MCYVQCDDLEYNTEDPYVCKNCTELGGLRNPFDYTDTSCYYGWSISCSEYVATMPWLEFCDICGVLDE